MSHNLLANTSSTRDSGNFVKAYGELLHDKRLSPQDVFLLLSMMWMADYRTGTLHASYRQIATQARCNTSDLAKRLDRLVECGYVVVKKLGQYGGRTPSTYFIPGVVGPRATQPAEAPTTVTEAVAVPANKEEAKPTAVAKPAEKKPAEKPAPVEEKPRLPLLDGYCAANDVGYYELIKQLEAVGVDPSTLTKGLLDVVAGKLKLARAREGGVKSPVGWSVAVVKSELTQPSKGAHSPTISATVVPDVSAPPFQHHIVMGFADPLKYGQKHGAAWVPSAAQLEAIRQFYLLTPEEVAQVEAVGKARNKSDVGYNGEHWHCGKAREELVNKLKAAGDPRFV